MCVLEIQTYVFSDHGRSTREKLVFCAQSNGENACPTVVRNKKGDIRLADLDLDDLHEQLARETQARHQKASSGSPPVTAQKAYRFHQIEHVWVLSAPIALALANILEWAFRLFTLGNKRPQLLSKQQVEYSCFTHESALMIRPKPFLEILETQVRTDAERSSHSPSISRTVPKPHGLALMIRPKPFLEILESSRKRDTGKFSPSSPRNKGFSSDAFSPGYFKSFFVEERELGRGNRGVVLLVRHVLDGVNLGHFACKRAPFGDDRKWLEEMVSGVQSMQTLSHVNLASFRHFWLEDFKISNFGPSVPCAFILQQYCNGGTLQDYVLRATPLTKENLKERMRRRSRGLPEQELNANQPDMPANQVLSFLEDITSGLHHLHSHGYTHGNLKPTNCLLNDSGQSLRVLVNDFGLKTTDVNQYHAPEILRGTISKVKPGRYPIASDMFSLGMILHFMCFKRLPYGSAVEYEEYIDYDLLLEETTTWGTSNDQFEKRKDLPVTLLSLLKRLLSFDHIERPTTIEVLESIKSILNDLAKVPSSFVNSDLSKTKIITQCDGCKRNLVYFPDSNNLAGPFFCDEFCQVLDNASHAMASARQKTDTPRPTPPSHKQGEGKMVSQSDAQNERPTIQPPPSSSGLSQTQEAVAIEESKRQLALCRAALNKSPNAISIECGIELERKAYQEDPPIRLMVVNYLGHGSLGIVEEVRTRNESTDAFVRKRVLIPYSHRRQRLEIILQEARMLKALIHPHIVKIIGSYEDVSVAGRHFYSLLMSPVGDNDLKTLLDKTRGAVKSSHQVRIDLN